MENLTIFKNESFGEVRTVLINNEIWFVLNDVCGSLDIENPRNVKNRLEKDDVHTMDITDNLGRMQNTTVINEFALYDCVLLSRKANAKQFKRWITHEVIPEIRKTGAYSQMPRSYAEALRAFANEVEQKELMQKQRDEAIRTKAWIGSRREATAMNTASQKAKEVRRLKIALDRSKEYATVKRVMSATGRKYPYKPLKDYCIEAGLKWIKVDDVNYGTVNAYPAEAWENVYGVDLSELF